MRLNRPVLLLAALGLAVAVRVVVYCLPPAADSSSHIVTAPSSTLPVDADRWSSRPPVIAPPSLIHMTFHSAAMDVEVGYNIYLPPDYQTPANKEKRYPVFYWLHGLDQTENTNQYPIKFLEEAIRAGKIVPMIVVYISGGQRTYYTDNPEINSLSETAFIKELIPHIDKTYRTNPTRDQRAIAGMSMGGFGSLKFAFKYPELFSSVTSFAPGIRDPRLFAKERPDILRRMFHNDAAEYEANHPATLLAQNIERIKGKLPISLYVGTKDYLLAGSQALHQQMTALQVAHVYEEFPGIEHNLVKLAEQTKATPFTFAAEHFK